ncbi:MAG: hypothetical protein KAG96_05435, partial [Ichthyobacteriaceae bacterium]|nr:hypothetical protein [Ichthyobacteriaceae bacterium]
ETLPETQNGITTAIKASIGAKIHLTRFITLFGEFTLKRSFGDKIDGLDLVYSKSPDYINSINIGVKHVLY